MDTHAAADRRRFTAYMLAGNRLEVTAAAQPGLGEETVLLCIGPGSWLAGGSVGFGDADELLGKHGYQRVGQWRMTMQGANVIGYEADVRRLHA